MPLINPTVIYFKRKWTNQLKCVMIPFQPR